MSGLSAQYIATNSFSISGNIVDSFPVNRKVKCDCGIDGIKYSHVTASEHNVGDNITVVTIADSVLTANLTNVWFGIVKPGADTSLPLHDHSGDDGGGDLGLDGKVDKVTGSSLVSDTEIAKIHNRSHSITSTEDHDFPASPTNTKYLRDDGAWETPPGGEASVQSDWNQTITDADDFIKNKPTSMDPTSHDNTAHSTNYEAELGNPDVDGKVLSSTAVGVRSWVTMEGGGVGGGDVEEAPIDGNLYARKDAGWTDISRALPPALTVEGSPSDVPETPTLETGAFFSMAGDTHLNTDWQIRNSADTATIWESLADTSNKLSIVVPYHELEVSTEYIFKVRHRGTTYGESDWQSVTATTMADFMPDIVPNQIDHGPGPYMITPNYDTMTDTGYYGEVTGAEMGFPSAPGTWLASEIGLTGGIEHNSTAGFLKFYVGPSALCNRTGSAYVLFVARRSYRYSGSWNFINMVGGVDGTTIVTVDGVNYKIRLMQGADADPSTYTVGTSCADNPGENSEWNDLIYRIHTDVPNCDDIIEGMGMYGTTRHGGPQVGDNWANLTDGAINVGSGDGRSSWCQEVDGADPDKRILRGSSGVANFGNFTYTSHGASTPFLGWRPVLELV